MAVIAINTCPLNDMAPKVWACLTFLTNVYALPWFSYPLLIGSLSNYQYTHGYQTGSSLAFLLNFRISCQLDISTCIFLG